jgi:hypothetical protein
VRRVNCAARSILKKKNYRVLNLVLLSAKLEQLWAAPKMIAHRYILVDLEIF